MPTSPRQLFANATNFRGHLPLAELEPSQRDRVAPLVDDGLLILQGDRMVLTDRGRLLADGIVRTLLD